MRLWHAYALGKLPDKLLAALHRDVCNLRANPNAKLWKDSWYYGTGAIWWYHCEVMAEMRRRGWHHNRSWEMMGYCGRKSRPIPEWLTDDDKSRHLSAYFASNQPAQLFQDIADIEKWSMDNEPV